VSSIGKGVLVVNEKQIEAINAVKTESKKLLYYGEEASSTLMEAYWHIIEAENDGDIEREVSEFKVFVDKHNQKYLLHRLNKM
jgi:hypothetical protein